ncbi:MAG: winged helix-turn-helix domain-containing protein [Candidatus Thermoplasmatota archaeon]
MSVEDTTIKFGENAGRIWHILNEHGCLDKNEVLEKTEMNEEEFYSGVGWLARENKVLKEDDCYQLGDTNLESHIGTNAGKIWEILDMWKKADIPLIKRIMRADKKDIYSALGWLKREEKIHFEEENTVCLK